MPEDGEPILGFDLVGEVAVKSQKEWFLTREQKDKKHIRLEEGGESTHVGCTGERGAQRAEAPGDVNRQLQKPEKSPLTRHRQSTRGPAAFGGVAERSKAAVLKTVDSKESRGSNPFSSDD